MSVIGDGLAFAGAAQNVLIRWDDVAVWTLSKKYLMISTNLNGRVIIPLAGVPEPVVEVITDALRATKAPKRRISAGGNVTKFSDAGRGELLSLYSRRLDSVRSAAAEQAPLSHDLCKNARFSQDR